MSKVCTKKREKVQRCFYLPLSVLEEGRLVSEKTGIPLSRLVADGLRVVVERQKAIELLRG